MAGNRHIHGQKENRLTLFRSRRQSPEKLNNPKPLFSRIEEFYFSKQVKENALASEGKSYADQTQKPQKIDLSV